MTAMLILGALLVGAAVGWYYGFKRQCPAADPLGEFKSTAAKEVARFACSRLT